MSDDNDYELIGRATVAWNDVELSWYLIYLVLMQAPREQADAVYFTPKSFGTERKFVAKLIDVNLAGHTAILADFKILSKMTDDYVGLRNAINPILENRDTLGF